ncbi:MAG: U32 family peptidase, partial [Rhodocyclaceae bacterium]|nr:U32 family peptidase [Rhodocyclaceae bacterium]
SQLVLARELTLEEIRAIRQVTATPAATPAATPTATPTTTPTTTPAATPTTTLEFFIHGALCVSYSGQCTISQALTGRSANRGECAQLCRLPWSLAESDGQLIAKNKHLLSLKDNNQSANLLALMEAGIRSFKIEGRMKDLSYVKNITAHYRRLLDNLMAETSRYRPASSGHCTFFFMPHPQKTFNRGATDYFVNERKLDIAAFDTPKFAGEPIGTVTKRGTGWFEVDSHEPLHNGDGLTWFDAKHELTGLRVNRVETQGHCLRIFPTTLPDHLVVGTLLHRNLDHEFERHLEKKSADRRLFVQIILAETSDGLRLTMTDEDGVSATFTHPCLLTPARNSEQARNTIHEHLGKLGNTIFEAKNITLHLSQTWFIPASTLNALRRETVELLEATRLSVFARQNRRPATEPPPLYPETELTYLGNVYNAKARTFYEKHGVTLIAPAFEAGHEKNDLSLMITRHCLRYSFHLCPKQVKGLQPTPMILINNNEKLTLRFDCKRCEMHVIGKSK